MTWMDVSLVEIYFLIWCTIQAAYFQCLGDLNFTVVFIAIFWGHPSNKHVVPTCSCHVTQQFLPTKRGIFLLLNTVVGLMSPPA